MGTSKPASILTMDVAKTKDSLAAYLNAKFQVTGYVLAVNNTDISGISFKSLPADLQKKLPKNPEAVLKSLNDHLATAKGHAMNWKNNIEPDLTIIPQRIIDFNTKFQNYIKFMIPLIDQLGNGDDPKIRKELQESFQALYKKIGSAPAPSSGGSSSTSTDPAPPAPDPTTLIGAVTIEVGKIKGFNTDINSDHDNFSDNNSSFAAIKAIDQANLTIIQNNLKSIIKAIGLEDKVITATAIGAGASVVVIGVGGALIASGGVVKPIIGAILMVIGGIGLAISVAELINAINQKAQLESEKTTDELEISALTQQLQSLEATQGSLGTLVTKSQEAVTATQVILNTWVTLQKKVNSVITDLHTSQDDTFFLAMKADLNTAKDQWNQLQTFATQMQATQAGADVQAKNKSINIPFKSMKKAS